MLLFGLQAIAGIAESWEQITLDIGPYKDRGHFRLKYELCRYSGTSAVGHLL